MIQPVTDAFQTQNIRMDKSLNPVWNTINFIFEVAKICPFFYMINHDKAFYIRP